MRRLVADGQDVQGRELGEPEAEVTKLAGEADDELAPQGAAHRDALADLADVLDARPGGEDRGREVRFEGPGDRAPRRRTGRGASGFGPRLVA